MQKIIDEDFVDLTMIKEAKDVLEEITQKKFENMLEWKIWWKKNKNKFVPRAK